MKRDRTFVAFVDQDLSERSDQTALVKGLMVASGLDAAK